MLRLLVLFFGLTAASASLGAEALITFEKDVRPILKAQCFQCHGEDGELKGGLDVRLRRFLVKGGESGPAIVPGKPEASRLFELIRKAAEILGENVDDAFVEASRLPPDMRDDVGGLVRMYRKQATGDK